MCPQRAAPPAADLCLELTDNATKKKGGTLIRPEVSSIKEHDRWLDLGLYKPKSCRCGKPVHSHGTRTRMLAGALGTLEEMATSGLVILIAVFRCSSCKGVWRVLPGFIPRWLHSSWEVVHGAISGRVKKRVPERTRRRWAARLRQDGTRPARVLVVSGASQLRELIAKLRPSPSRGELVCAFAALCPAAAVVVASLAELLHRMMPGIRLM
jgi:hypothetical protein